MGYLGMFPKWGIGMLPPVVSHVLLSPGVHILSGLPHIAHIFSPTHVTDQVIPHIISSTFSSFPPAMFAGQAFFTVASLCFAGVGFLEFCFDLCSPLFLNFYLHWPRVFIDDTLESFC